MVDARYKIQMPSAAKQFGIALFFGAIAATITYQVTTRMAEPDKRVTDGGYKFVFFMSALVGGAVFIIVSKIYKAWADKKYRESLGPPTARKLPD